MDEDRAEPQPSPGVQVDVATALDYARFEARIMGLVEGLQMALAVRRNQIFKPIPEK